MTFAFRKEELVAKRNFAYWMASYIPEGSWCARMLRSFWHVADATYALKQYPSVYFAAREDFNKVCIDFYEKFTVSVPGNPDLQVFDYKLLEKDLVGWKSETVTEFAGIIKNMMVAWTKMHLDGLERLATVPDQQIDTEMLEAMYKLQSPQGDTDCHWRVVLR